MGPLVQAAFEGFAVLVFETTAGPTVAAVSVLGNTVTHGLLLGALPLVLLSPHVRDRLEARVT